MQKLDSKAAMRELDREEAKGKEKRRKREAKRVERRAELQAIIDAMLDRITEVGGVDNLSSHERKQLERASRDIQQLDD